MCGTVLQSLSSEFTVRIVTFGIDQKTIFTSYFAPVQLVAFFPDGTEETIYVNKSANSPYGQCPLRLAWPQLLSSIE